MSDFGANIFDDEPGAQPPPPSRAAPQRQQPPPPAPATPPTATPPLARDAAPAGSTPLREEPVEPSNPWARAEREAPAKGPARRDAPRRHEHAGEPRDAERPREPGRAPGRGPDRHTVFRPAPPGRHAEDRSPQHRDSQQRGPRTGSQQSGSQQSGSQQTGSRQSGARGGAQHAPHQAVAPAAGAAAPPNAAATVRAGVAVLIDLDALQTEARAQRGELSLQRLRAVLGGDRPVQHAIAFAAGTTTAPLGFELLASADPGLAPGVRFAAAAIDLLARTGSLVLAPASPWNRQLAAALRAAGHTVDLAGFDAADGAGERIRVLGRDCLFVP